MTMQFLASLPTFGQDNAARTVWRAISEKLGDTDGIAYYKHPVIGSAGGLAPDLAVLARGFQPLAVICLPYALDEISAVSSDSWQLSNGDFFDAPTLVLEDYVVALASKFDRERQLRRLFAPVGAIALPLMSKSSFEEHFGAEQLASFPVIWSDGNLEKVLIENRSPDDAQWRIAKSVFQGIHPLNRGKSGAAETADKLGAAIAVLEREISLLDDEQHKVAVQIAPGPQRIRGLAGTGKTVVLAMKAANIHLHYPDKKILFTFNTQSLYNQARNLITKFYRVNSETDPNWDNLHVRHGWGGSLKPGVYSDTCKRLGIQPLIFPHAKSINPTNPFKACCDQLLQRELTPAYDFVLVDEAQDFPQEYFQILAKLSTEERRIYFAYDELQSLSSVEVPNAEELFGSDSDGKPLVSLGGDDYPGDIEKDFVLHRSYRCPHNVLMLAHGIGLGLHSPRGIVQMLANNDSWTSTGYEIKEGNLKQGSKVVICRPEANSPNRIREVYKGDQRLIDVRTFPTRQEEFSWVAASISADIKNEGVRPDQIMVISMNSKSAKTLLITLQRELILHDVDSTIPGLVNDSSEFMESDKVTLSTIYRAKGNEAPVVYITCFDELEGYVEEVGNRNRAFTAISRAKGFVRISGVGRQMDLASQEVDDILADVPCFRFTFPDMEKIARKLDSSETTRRRREVRKALNSVETLTQLGEGALSELDPEMLKKLKELIDKVDDARS